MTGLFLYNGCFHSMEEPGEVYNSCYIKDGHIKVLGDKENFDKFLPVGIDKIDLEGAVVTPGLVDGHAHFLHYSLSLQEIELSHCLSIKEAMDTIRKGLANGPSRDSWYIGRGWNKNNWGDCWPTRFDLDQITGNKPAAFFSQDFHCLWVNTAVLNIAGIDSSTLSPPGGEIMKDSKGQPTGIFKEDAISLIREYIPVPDLDEATLAIIKGMYVYQSIPV
ncbi:MAG TPA: amidohydrolase family protein, partial [Thermoanaerobacterales bacterium]|nr:amidohydrolase family protein [Thermoanaerobacterales bacterium]